MSGMVSKITHTKCRTHAKAHIQVWSCAPRGISCHCAAAASKSTALVNMLGDTIPTTYETVPMNRPPNTLANRPSTVTPPLVPCSIKWSGLRV